MPSLNEVTIMGHIVKEPELSYTNARVPYAKVDIAINESIRKKSGEWEQETTFVNNMVLWGKDAEKCMTMCKKGTLVLISGKLKLEKWDDKSRLAVQIKKIQYLNNRRDESSAQSYYEEKHTEPDPKYNDTIPF